MSMRVACQKCGAAILPATADRTGGLCMPCAQGKQRVLELALAQPAKVLTAQEYFALVRDLLLPSSEQRRNFVDYVAGAHSWYKHLPRYLPGAPFYFFIDRFAGCDCVALRDGSYAIAERAEQGFHYSDLPTAEYLTRFGFLNYSCAEGTAVFRLDWEAMVIPRDKVVAIPGAEGEPCCLPQAVLDAGRAELTAVVHPLSPSYNFWDQGVKPGREIHWPSESGGQTTLKRIFERCAAMRTPECMKEKDERLANCISRREACPSSQETTDQFDDPFVDPVLRNLLEPERVRQRTEMLKAIDRVCMLIDAAQQSATDTIGGP